MKRILILTISIILLLSLVACNAYNKEREQYTIKEGNNFESVKENEPKSIEEELLSHKKPFKQGIINAEEYLDQNQTVEALMEFAEYASKYQEERGLVQNVSFEDAKSDLDDYFSFLKRCYAGYLYFGGDEKFLSAKNNIIKGIPKEGISGKELENLILKELDFVKDAHFTIGKSQSVFKLSHMEVKNLFFGKDEEGIYNMATNKYIDKESNINEYLKPTLDSENRICYKLIADYHSDYPDKIIYKDGSFEELKWEGIRVKSISLAEKAELKTINEIPYLKFDYCYFKKHSQENYDILLEGAKSLSEAKYAILDLRGNMGGNGILPGEWIKHYSGNKITYSQDGFICINKDLDSISGNGQSYEDMVEYMGIEPYNDNHHLFRGSNEIYEKEGLLIVLIDGHVASAGELLVDALHHYSNTLFVGMSTLGGLISSSFTHYFMPNSGILVSFGNMLTLLNEEYFQEYKGFEPDIWLTSTNQEEQLSRLLNNIKIQSGDN